jgi:hypothetical protein
MTHRLSTLACTIAALLLASSGAAAQCTASSAWDDVVQTANNIAGVKRSAVTFSGSTTKAPDDPCGAKVQVEVWWEPGGTPAIDLQTTSASKNITQSGPTVYGAFTGTSKHWYIYNYSNPPGYSQTWQFKGQSSKSIDFGPRTEEEECEDANGQWYNDLCNYPSPILISFDRGAASQMTSVEDGVAFDLDADGALDRIGWTAPQTDVGFWRWTVTGTAESMTGQNCSATTRHCAAVQWRRTDLRR